MLKNGYSDDGKEADLVIRALELGVGIGCVDSEMTQKILDPEVASPVFLVDIGRAASTLLGKGYAK